MITNLGSLLHVSVCLQEHWIFVTRARFVLPKYLKTIILPLDVELSMAKDLSGLFYQSQNVGFSDLEFAKLRLTRRWDSEYVLGIAQKSFGVNFINVHVRNFYPRRS